MMLHQCLTTAGLFLDIIGVCLLFFFGLAPKNTWHYGLSRWRSKVLPCTGLILVVLGFGLQIVGSVCSPPTELGVCVAS